MKDTITVKSTNSFISIDNLLDYEQELEELIVTQMLSGISIVYKKYPVMSFDPVKEDFVFIPNSRFKDQNPPVIAYRDYPNHWMLYSTWMDEVNNWLATKTVNASAWQ